MTISNWTQDWLQKRGIPFYFFKQIDSTHSQAEKLLPNHQAPFVVLAHHQTQGRGSQDRPWIDSDLMITIAWKGVQNYQTLPSLFFSFALYKALSTSFPLNPNIWSIKSPNDLYLKERKVAGVLIKMMDYNLFKYTLLSIGLNVFQTHIKQATFIQKHTDVEISSWFQFLDLFWKEVTLAIKESHPVLNPKEIVLLKEVLKRNLLYLDLEVTHADKNVKSKSLHSQ